MNNFAMQVAATLILATLLAFVDSSVTPDEGVTAHLQEVWYHDNFVIALSNIEPKKKQSGPMVKTLLAIKYGESRTKVVLMLDRRTKRVILESLDEDGRRVAEHITVDTLSIDTPLKNLIVLVHQNQPDARVDVYVDCVFQGSIPLKRSFRELTDTEDSPFIKVFKERRSHVKVYRSSSISDALRQENCPDNLLDMDNLSPLHQKANSEIKTDNDRASHEPIHEVKDQLHRPSKLSRPQRQNREQNRHVRSKTHENAEEIDDFDYSDEPDATGYDDRQSRDRYAGYTSVPSQDRSTRPDDDYRSDKFDNERASRRRNYSERPGKSERSEDPRRLEHLNQLDHMTHRWDHTETTDRSRYTTPASRAGHDYPNETDADLSYKRLPRRGDIGIQSLDERACLTDSQIVKTLNELIDATRKVWREIELNRLETQHLRQLIENCAGCRAPIGE